MTGQLITQKSYSTVPYLQTIATPVHIVDGFFVSGGGPREFLNHGVLQVPEGHADAEVGHVPGHQVGAGVGTSGVPPIYRV
jgi:hypothetical protein